MSADSGTLYWLPLILNHAELDPTDTLLLIALADHVDADDRCWVGIHRLAGWSRVSYGTARRRLTDLEARGYITRRRRVRQDGSEGVYEYELCRSALNGGARNMRGGSAQNARGVRAPGRAGGARTLTRAQNYPLNYPLKKEGVTSIRVDPGEQDPPPAWRDPTVDVPEELARARSMLRHPSMGAE